MLCEIQVMKPVAWYFEPFLSSRPHPHTLELLLLSWYPLSCSFYCVPSATFFFFLVVVVLTHKTLEISDSPRLRSVPRILQPSEAVMALPYYGVEDVIGWISEIHDEGNKREGVVKERQTIVLRQTANLVNFIPPQLPTFFPPLAGKLSNPINSSKQWWCSIVCRLGCLQTCSLYANSPLVMHADALFLCPQSLCYANQTTGAL